MSWTKIEMAREVLSYIPKFSSINLGIGMPTLIADLLDPKMKHIIHSENGVLGVSGRPAKDAVSPTLINAGKETIEIQAGASFFDSALSFGMIRGGHIDYCILGGMEVDSFGSLANWMIPGKKVTGMGGAMDLVNGAKNVFVMMNHQNKNGESKLVKTCSLPLTGKSVVDYVFTERGVFQPCEGVFKVISLSKNTQILDLDQTLFQGL